MIAISQIYIASMESTFETEKNVVEYFITKFLPNALSKQILMIIFSKLGFTIGLVDRHTQMIAKAQRRWGGWRGALAPQPHFFCRTNYF